MKYFYHVCNTYWSYWLLPQNLGRWSSAPRKFVDVTDWHWPSLSYLCTCRFGRACEQWTI